MNFNQSYPIHLSEKCMCQVWGDPHFETFDGLKYNYQGPCTYLLFSLHAGPCNTEVYIKNVRVKDGKASVAREMYIYVFYHRQDRSVEVIIKPGKVLMVGINV